MPLLLFILLILVEMIYGKCWVLNNKELNYINSNNCVSSNNGIDSPSRGYLKLNNNYKESSITINDYSNSNDNWYIQYVEHFNLITQIFFCHQVKHLQSYIPLSKVLRR